MFKSLIKWTNISPKNVFLLQQIRCKTIWDNAPKLTQQQSPVLARITEEQVKQNMTSIYS
jgi:hypothetical protein